MAYLSANFPFLFAPGIPRRRRGEEEEEEADEQVFVEAEPGKHQHPGGTIMSHQKRR
jgi:hypothetical protein